MSIGEPPVIPVAPAIANAVQDAVGARIYDLPITAEKVLRALRAERSEYWSDGVMDEILHFVQDDMFTSVMLRRSRSISPLESDYGL